MLLRVEQTARLHAALRDYDGDELGFWAPFGTYIPEGLAELKRLPAVPLIFNGHNASGPSSSRF